MDGVPCFSGFWGFFADISGMLTGEEEEGCRFPVPLGRFLSLWCQQVEELHLCCRLTAATRAHTRCCHSNNSKCVVCPGHLLDVKRWSKCFTYINSKVHNKIFKNHKFPFYSEEIQVQRLSNLAEMAGSSGSRGGLRTQAVWCQSLQALPSAPCLPLTVELSGHWLSHHLTCSQPDYI